MIVTQLLLTSLCCVIFANCIPTGKQFFFQFCGKELSVNITLKNRSVEVENTTDQNSPDYFASKIDFNETDNSIYYNNSQTAGNNSVFRHGKPEFKQLNFLVIYLGIYLGIWLCCFASCVRVYGLDGTKELCTFCCQCLCLRKC